MDIATLRKSRGLDFSKITSALAKSQEGGQSREEDDFYKLTKDKAGNASAVIRFLPAAEGDDLPWVQIYSHAFQGPAGRWYIENCLSTIGKDDPVNDYNRELWKGSEKDKEQARKQKRKLQYVASIYVVSDPGNRENEGKVFKFKFGKKIFEKITEKLEPTFEDEKPINVFDLWEGANFKLRMRQVEGYPNYDQSTFGEIGAIADTDEEIVEIVKMQKPLRDMVDPSKFKSYDELKKKLDSVLSAGAPIQSAREALEETVAAPKAAPVKEAPAQKTKSAPIESSDTDEDEEMKNFFDSL